MLKKGLLHLRKKGSLILKVINFLTPYFQGVEIAAFYLFCFNFLPQI
jgi:hypothetical protein